MERSAALIAGAAAVTATLVLAPACLARAAISAKATPSPPAAENAALAFSTPVALSAPTTLSILGTQVASSPAGAAAIAFDEVNLDAQATAGAFVALAAPHQPFGTAVAVPGAQEVLAIAYAGNTLELLTASGPAGEPCCSTVQVIRYLARSGFGVPQTLVTAAGGATTGRLVALGDGRMLTVIGAPQGLWVSTAGGAGGFAAPRGLTRVGSGPAALAVAATAAGASTVVWTRGAGRSIFAASAGPGGTPTRARTLLSAPAGHAVDGLQLLSGATGLTLGWSESWNEAAGGFHSEARAADVASRKGRLRPRALSAPGEVASALALAGDGEGDEVATWEVCSFFSQACSLRSSVRRNEVSRPRGKKGKRGRKARPRHARWFGPASREGQVDPGESPQVTMTSHRGAILGWISGGRVVIAAMAPGATRFGTGRSISGSLADNLALGFGPAGRALAAWTQGTSAPRVYASLSR